MIQWWKIQSHWPKAGLKANRRARGMLVERNTLLVLAVSGDACGMTVPLQVPDFSAQFKMENQRLTKLYSFYKDKCQVLHEELARWVYACTGREMR